MLDSTGPLLCAIFLGAEARRRNREEAGSLEFRSE